jgi:hypothetical protein
MDDFLGIKYDSKKLSDRFKKEEEIRLRLLPYKPKVDEMYRVKHKLFDYIHQRIRSYGKSHKSQKLGWYKKRWGNQITQYYYCDTTKKVKGDLDRIIRKLNDELIRVQNLSKKNFKTSFSHKVPKYKQRIQKEMNSERNDVVVNHYKGVVIDLD